QGYDHLAEITVCNRFAGNGLNYLNNERFVDDHAVAARPLIGDDAHVGGRVALQHLDAARSELLLQRSRQGSTGDECVFERGRLARFFSSVKQDLQKVRRPDVARRREAGDRCRRLLECGTADWYARTVV